MPTRAHPGLCRNEGRAGSSSSQGATGVARVGDRPLQGTVLALLHVHLGVGLQQPHGVALRCWFFFFRGEN